MNSPQEGAASLPLPLVRKLEDALGSEVRTCTPVGGGCIAHAGRLETAGGTYFLKWSDGDAAQAFVLEAQGLRALREAAGAAIAVPEVIDVERGGDEHPGFLVLEWIDEGSQRQQCWEALGEGLASLHRHTNDRYGFEADNFIGRLPQKNGWRDRWPIFFREERLAPQVAMARERGRWRQAWDAPLENLHGQLGDLLPEQPEASLLHGDLWGGNILATSDGRPVILDPAVYYGHRETDLAMSELFGCLPSPFYRAYRNAWPLASGYEERREIYNLYHLINHLNHFGASYAPRVERTLRRFG